MSGSSSDASRSRTPAIAALLAFAHAGWIWWMSSRSFHVPGDKVFGFLGNSFHFVLFGILAILLAEALRRDGGLTRARLVIVLLLVLAYGIVDEYHQSFTPNRQPDPGDVCIDLLGGIGGVSLWWGVRGPGRFGRAVLRLIAVGVIAAAFNAWRSWGNLSTT